MQSRLNTILTALTAFAHRIVLCLLLSLSFLSTANAQTQTLSISSLPTAGGVVTESSNIHCGTENRYGSNLTAATVARSNCSHAYTQNSTATLIARPNRFYSFAGWAGGCAGEGARYTVLMDSDKACQALFVKTNGYVQLDSSSADATGVQASNGRFARPATASRHTCALTSLGGVDCWGHDVHGRFGLGAGSADRHVPTALSLASSAIAISVGRQHGCAVLANGNMQCWGRNRWGQLGDNSRTDRASPVAVMNMTNAVSVSVGVIHTCALRTDNTVWCWGASLLGLLGYAGASIDQTARTPQSAVDDITTAVAVSAGLDHTCALLADGGVRCWGFGLNGDNGDGNNQRNRTPVTVADIDNAMGISSGSNHTCAVLEDGGVRCWGRNNQGQLGDNSISDRSKPVAASGIADAVQISSGDTHTCAVLSDGSARCWGQNNVGQLGTGNTSNSLVPVAVTGIDGLGAIAAGYENSCALKRNATAYCWGTDSNGAIGNDTTTHSDGYYTTAQLVDDQTFDGSMFSVATTETEALVFQPKIAASTSTWSLSPTTLPTGLVFSARTGTLYGVPSAGTTAPIDYTLVAQSAADSTLIVLNLTVNNILDDITIVDSNPIPNAILANTPNNTTIDTISLQARDGPLPIGVSWSLNPADARFSIHSTSGAITLVDNSSLTVGDAYTLTVEARALEDTTITGSKNITIHVVTMRTFSINPLPQHGSVTVSPPALSSNVTTCGTSSITSLPAPTQTACTYTYATTADAELRLTATPNPFYQFVGWQGDCSGTARSITITIGQGKACSPVFTKDNTGTYILAGVGPDRQCLIARDGTIRCWGFSGGLRKLGLGDITGTVNSPTLVDNRNNVYSMIAIDLAQDHTCAVLSRGQVACWGGGNQGQIGWGNVGSRDHPAIVTRINNAVDVAVGGQHSCAVLVNGTVQCWGRSSSGALGSGSATAAVQLNGPAAVAGVSDAISIAAYGDHVCVALRDGRIQCWGSNDSGQLGNTSVTGNTSSPVYVSNITSAQAVATGSQHTCAVLADQSLRCWGRAAEGQLGNNDTATNHTNPVAVLNIHNAIAISAADHFSCAILQDKSMRCWGRNNHRQLGNNSTNNSAVPVAVQGVTTAQSVSSNAGRVCAILEDGAAYCWGDRFGNTPSSVATLPAPAFTSSSVPLSLSLGHYASFAPAFSGAVGSFSITGNLPQGILFSTATGILFGIPTVANTTPQEFTITAHAAGSDSTASFRITNFITSSSPTAIVIRDINTQANTVSESTVPGDTLSTVTLQAQDQNNQAIGAAWSLTTDAGRNPFAINPGTGAITLTGILDFETQRSYLLTATARFPSAAQKQAQPTLGDLSVETPLAIRVENTQEYTLRIGQSELGSAVTFFDGDTASRLNNPRPITRCGYEASNIFSQNRMVRTDCFAEYPFPVQLRIIARPIPGNRFVAWQGRCGNRPIITGTLGATVGMITILSLDCTPVFVRAHANYYMQVSAAQNHRCLLQAGGTIQCWGESDNGRLGNGETADTTAPGAIVTGISTAIDVSAGREHTCAVLANGTAWCWGRGQSGRLGNALSSGDRAAPVQAGRINNFTDIDAGTNYTCAITSDGEAYCWGNSSNGKLGDGGGVNRNVPTRVGTLSTVIDIATGSDSTCAVLQNGEIYCWGSGYANTPMRTHNTISTAIAVDVQASHACVALSNGTAQCWGSGVQGRLGQGAGTPPLNDSSADSNTPVTVLDLNNAVDITLSEHGSCALLINGSVKCWGRGDLGSIGDGTDNHRDRATSVSNLSTAISLDSASSDNGIYTCAVRTDGTVVCWGQGVNSDGSDSNVPVAAFTLPALSITPNSGSLTIYEDYPFGFIPNYQGDAAIPIYDFDPGWSVTNLPAGLAFSNRTGAVYGTLSDTGSAISSAITISARNSDSSQQASFTITAITVESSSTVTIQTDNSHTRSIDENVSLGTAITPAFNLTIANGTAVSWTLTPANIPFVIASGTPTITVTDRLNFDTAPTYTLTATAAFPFPPQRAALQPTFTPSSDQVTLTINVIEGFDSIIINSDTPSPIPENTATGTVITGLNLSVTDDRGGNQTSAVSWSLGPANTPFAIASNTGVITLTEMLDYEATSAYALTLTAQIFDPPFSDTQDIALTVANVLESFTLTDTDDAPNTITENAPVNTPITGLSLQAQDEQPVTVQPAWSLEPNNTPFSINPTSGAITLTGSLDYEITTDYKVTVHASYTQGAVTETNTLDIAITVNNVLETLTISDADASTNAVIDADTRFANVLGLNLQAQEGATPVAVQWSLNPASPNFSIDSTSGVITLVGDVDRTVQDTYMLTVVAQAIANPALTDSEDIIIRVVVAHTFSIRPVPQHGLVRISPSPSGDTATCGVSNANSPQAPTQTACDYRYDRSHNPTLSITATPVFPYQFVGWQGDCVGLNPSLTVTLDRDKTCAPIFIRNNSDRYTQVSVAQNHRCLLQARGVIQCWGEVDNGRLGNGAAADTTAPGDTVTGISTAIDVSAGENHTCAVLANGTAWCWGHDGSQQLGNGATSGDQAAPTQVVNITNFTDIDAGNGHTCAITADSHVYCWGFNDRGQLGIAAIGGTADLPVRVGTLSNVVDVATERDVSCAVLRNGQIWCWGSGYANAPMRTQDTISNAIAVDVEGAHACVVLRDGQVRCWGYAAEGRTASGAVTNAVDITLSEHTSCALLSNGGVQCWGRGDFGSIGNGANDDAFQATAVSNLSDAIYIDSANENNGVYTCAIRGNGDVVCWGQRVNSDGSNSNVPVVVATATPPAFNPSSVSLPPLYLNNFVLLTPSYSGAISEFSITGDLPQGLFFSTATGILLGTPRAATTSPRDFTIVAHDPDNITTASFTITNFMVSNPPTTIAVQDTNTQADTIAESALPGSSLSTVTLQAQNQDDQAVTVNWSFTTATTPFAIHPDSGAITLTSLLDFETQARYTLTVTASFPNTEQKQLQPSLTDIDVQISLTIQVEDAPENALTITPSGQGLVTASLLGSTETIIRCGTETPNGLTLNTMAHTDCAVEYAASVQIRISATPISFYQFAGWHGDCNATSVSFTLTLDQNKTCTPLFIRTTSGRYTQVAVAQNHRCLLQARGAIQCFGESDNGRLGNGAGSDTTAPGTIVTGISTAIDVSAGENHTCAALENGTAWCWGHDGDGQLGNGDTDTDDQAAPVQVSNITNVTDIDAGNGYTCAITADAEVYCWGKNDQGQLGVGDTNMRDVPTRAGTLNTAVDIATAGGFTCAISQEGTIYCWGANYQSTPMQTQNTISNAIAIDTEGVHACAALSDGRVHCWGTWDGNYRISGASNVTDAVDVALSEHHSCALLGNGGVQCWGRGTQGQVGNGMNTANNSSAVNVSNLSTAISLDASNSGDGYSCAVRADSTVVCWGRGVNSDGSNSNVPVAVAMPAAPAFDSSSIALPLSLDHFTLFTPALSGGASEFSITGNLPQGIRFSTATGTLFGIPSVANEQGGRRPANGAPTFGPQDITITAHAFDDTTTASFRITGLTVSSSPTAITVRDTNTQANTISESALPGSPLSTVTLQAQNQDDQAISASWSFTTANTPFAIHPDSGAITLTSLLDFETQPSHILTVTARFPVAIQKQTQPTLGDLSVETPLAIQVEDAPDHTLTITPSRQGLITASLLGSTETVIRCGYGTATGFAHDTMAHSDCTTENAVPYQVRLTATPIPFYQFVAWRGDCTGTNPSLTLTLDQDRTCTSLFTPITSERHIQISAARNHRCLLQERGTIQCFGAHANGRLGNGATADTTAPGDTVTGISTAIDVSAGENHTCAVLADGTAQCWGHGAEGQLGNGATPHDQATPVRVSNISNLIDIDAGVNYTCALTDDGEVYCWGLNSSGQLGVGDNNRRTVPTRSGTLSTAIDIATETDTSCAVLRDGTIFCWGATQTSYEQARRAISNAIAVDVEGTHSCALLRNGEARCWGNASEGRLAGGPGNNVTNLNTAIDIALSEVSTCALLSNGDVQCWGKGDFGQIGDGRLGFENSVPKNVSNLSAAIAIDGSNGDQGYNCALRNDGALLCWGQRATHDNKGAITAAVVVMPISPAFKPSSVVLPLSVSHFAFFTPTFNDTVSEFSITGNLPQGITFSTATGTLFGIPAVASATPQDIVITAHVLNSDATAEFRITGLEVVSILTAITIQDTNTQADTIAEDTLPGSALSAVTLQAQNQDGETIPARWSLTPTQTPFAIHPDSGAITLSRLLDFGAQPRHTLTVTARFPDSVQKRVQPTLTDLDAQITLTVQVEDRPDRTLSITQSEQGFVLASLIGTTASLVSNAQPVIHCGYEASNIFSQNRTARTDCFVRYPFAVQVRILARPIPGYQFVTWQGDCSGTNPSIVIALNQSTNCSAFFIRAPAAHYIQVAAAQHHSCLLQAGGTIQCWGESDDGRLGNGATGDQDAPGTAVTNISTAIDVSAGENHSCAVLSNGTAWCWGDDSDGQLGNGATTGDQAAPVQAGSINNFTDIDAGVNYTCAMTADGEVYCWGKNSAGQLGAGDSGDDTDRDVPTRSGTISTAIDIATEADASCAVLQNGTISCWGSGYANTPMRTQNTISNAIAVDVEGAHACVALSNGQARCWGFDADGRLGGGPDNNVTNLNSAIDITLSEHTSCALLRDGGVKCWGRGGEGAIGDGNNNNRDRATSVSNLSTAISLDSANGDSGVYTCAVRTDGVVVCWGQSANIDNSNADIPVTPFPTSIIALFSPASASLTVYQDYPFGITPSPATGTNHAGAVKSWSVTNLPATLSFSTRTGTVYGTLSDTSQAVSSAITIFGTASSNIPAGFTITAIAVESSPTLSIQTVSNPTRSISENADIGTVIAPRFDLATVNNVSATWTLTPRSNPFVIRPDASAIVLTDYLNRETQASYTLTAIASFQPTPQRAAIQPTLTSIRDQATLTISVADGYDSIVIANDPPDPIAENASVNTAITGLNLSVTDANGGDRTNAVSRWSLEPSNTPFAIAADSGAITLTAATLDYEATNRYTITLTAQHLNLSDEHTIILTVSNILEGITIEDTDPSPNTIDEDAASDTPVTGLSLQAQDERSVVVAPTWSLQPASTLFAINPSSGIITLTGPLDFEATSKHTVTAHASYTQGAVTATNTLDVIISVNNSFETLTISDADAGDNTVVDATPHYPTVLGLDLQVLEGTDLIAAQWSLNPANPSFAINSSNGVITLVGDVDHAVQDSYTLTVEARALTDNTVTDSEMITIHVTRAHTLNIRHVPQHGTITVSPSPLIANASACSVGNTISPTASTQVTCTYSYDAASDTELHITARPIPLYQFVAWQGDCSGTNPSVTLTLDQDRTCTPLFTRDTSERYIQVSASQNHRCLLQAQGTIQCWGERSNGRLGNGAVANTIAPGAVVTGISTAIDVSAGENHTCAILENGTAWCWGRDNDGQLGNGAITGDQAAPVTVSSITNFADIDAGVNYTCAITSDGEVYCWGANNHGQLGLGDTQNRDTPTRAGTLSTAIDIATETTDSCAVLQDGTLYCWGGGTSGYGNTPVRVHSSVVSAIAVDVEGAHACIALRSGQAQCWGYGAHGRLGQGAGTRFSSAQDSATPVTVVDLNTAIDISIGEHHSCALLSGGGVKCWGRGEEGAIGDGTNNRRDRATSVSNLTTAISLDSAHGDNGIYSCAVRTNGEVVCWGQNQASDASNTNIPVIAASPSAPVLSQDSISVAVYYNQNLIWVPELASGVAQVWSVTGTLPAGIRFSTATGSLFGAATPDAQLSTLTLIAHGIESDQNSEIRVVLSPQASPTTITIIDTQSNPNTINENALIGSPVNNLQLQAQDQNSQVVAVRWSFTTTQTPFAIHPDSGAITLTGALDFETTPIHTLTVAARFPVGIQQAFYPTLAPLRMTQRILIQVQDNFDSIIVNATSPVTVPESTAVGSAITGINLSVMDNMGGDQTNAASWSLASSATPFTINANSGQITLTGALDFETTPRYTLTISATVTAGNTLVTNSIDIVIAVADVLESLTISNSATGTATIASNAPINTRISNLNLIARDENTNTRSDVTWRIQPPHLAFRIDPNSGVVAVADTTALQNTSSLTSISVLASAVVQGTTITSNTLNIPIDTSQIIARIINTASGDIAVSEDASPGTAVTGVRLQVQSNEGTAASTVTWSIISAPASTIFDIAADGTLSVRDSSTLDYETNPRVPVLITASRSGEPDLNIGFFVTIRNATEAITITDTNDAPNAIAENTAPGTPITSIALTAQDEHSMAIAAMWSITGSQTLFAIGTSSGEITLAQSPDFEASSRHTITVRAAADTNPNVSNTINLTITISNVSESITIEDSNDAPSEIVENTPPNTPISSIALTAQDEHATTIPVMWSITSSQTLFAIGTSSGKITLAQSPDFEASSRHTITVRAAADSNPSITNTIDLTISISNVLESLTISNTAATTATIASNASTNTPVSNLNLSVHDEGMNSPSGVAWRIQPPNPAFRINMDLGVVTVADTTALRNISGSTSLSVLAGVVGQGAVIVSNTLNIPIDVLDISFRIVNTASGDITVSESASPGTAVTGVRLQVEDDSDRGAAVSSVTWIITNTSSPFSIANNGTLTVQDSNALDYEASATVNVVVTASRAGEPDLNIIIPVTLLNVLETIIITDTDDAPNAVAENTAPNTPIPSIALVAQDENGATIAADWAFIGVSDLFGISGNDGRITLLRSPDFEATTRHTIIVQAEANANRNITDTLTVTIDITNVAEMLTVEDSNPADNTIAENTATGTEVTSIALTAVDEHGNAAAVMWSITNAQTLFAISSTSGQITLAESPDFEGTSRHTITVRAAVDANPNITNTIELAIDIINALETLTIIDTNSASNVISENSDTGTTITSIALVARDESMNPIAADWALIGRSDLFGIGANDGRITLLRSPDFEATSRHIITVQAQADANRNITNTIELTIAVTNVLEMLTITDSNPAIRLIAENTATGTEITSIALTVQDERAVAIPVMWSITNAQTLFAISSMSGQIALAQSPDFEAPQNSYTLTVRAAADANPNISDTIKIGVNITNVLETLTIVDTNLSSDTIAENTATGTEVTSVALSAQDERGAAIPAMWSITNTQDLFNIGANNGQITLARSPDFEAPQNSYTITVHAAADTDASITNTIELTIAVTNVLESLAVTNTNTAGNANIASNATVDTLVSNLTLEARDESNTIVNTGLVWTITSQTIANLFRINSNDARVTLRTLFSLLPSVPSSATITVRASDSTTAVQSPALTIPITIVDTNLVLTESTATSNTIAEDAAANTPVTGLSLSVADADGNPPTQSVTWAILTANTPFMINPNTGAITLTGSIDYETTTQHHISVQATAPSASDPDNPVNLVLPVTIDVTNVLEMLTIEDTNNAPNTIAENSATGTQVTTIDLVAEDEGTRTVTAVWSITNAPTLFTISTTNGQITLAQSPDFEAMSRHTITVQAVADADSITVTGTLDLSIDISNILETLTATDSNLAPNTIPENATTDTSVTGVTLTATNENSVTEPGVSWSATTSTTPFVISTTGIITLANNTLDYEATSRYTFTVQGSKQGIHSNEFPLTITVTNVLEMLTIFNSGTTGTIAANATTDVADLALTATDENNTPVTNLTWSVVNASGNLINSRTFAINSATGIVNLAQPNRNIVPSTQESITALLTIRASKDTIQSNELTIPIIVTRAIDALRFHLKLFLEGPLQ